MTDNEQPPFAFGQHVFVAWAYGHAEHKEPCPICFGQKFATLILGNGEHVPVECGLCGHGFEGPRGYITEYGASSGVREGEVTGLSREWEKWEVRVNGCYEELRDIFLDRDAAEVRRAALLEAVSGDVIRRRADTIKYKSKTLTWKAGYHRRCIKQAEHDIAYHRERLQEIPPAKRDKPAVAPSPGSTP